MAETAELQRTPPKQLQGLAVAGMLQQVIDKAESISPDAFVNSIERLAKLQCEMMDRDARSAYIQAFEDFKRDAPQIVKDAAIMVNGQERGKYAKLDKVCGQLVPALLRVGITHRWKTRMADDGKMIFVTCYLRHRLGHEEEGATLGAPPDTSGSKNPVQAHGSTVSYLERYTLVASCGIAIKDHDTDGNIAPDEAGQPLGESVVLDFIDSIKDSTTPEELKRNFQAALKAATDAKDSKSSQAFTKAKNDTWRKRGFHA